MVPAGTGGPMPPRDLFQGCRYLADGRMAQQILDGTYVYPPDLDPANKTSV